MKDSKVSECISTIIILVILLFIEAWIIQISWNVVGPIFWKSAPILTYIQSVYMCILLGTIGSFFKRKELKIYGI